ncbi:MAG TPA: anti-sigma factor [Candidatus Nanopelagicales bacterium]|nr:anti-sigma factor [Candidatus Nanopelagicales bacterium]
MPHYDDVTLALLALGEPGATTDSEAHLATCDQCRHEVESLGAAAAVARSVRPEDAPVTPSPEVWDRIVRDLEQPRIAAVPLTVEGAPADAVVMPMKPRRWSRAAALLAAAAVGVIVGAGGMRALGQGEQPGPAVAAPQVATASLKPLDDPSASGTAVIRQASTALRTVTVVVTGLPQHVGTFYEVWLMDPSNAHLVALGVLDSSGHGEFAVPAGLDLSTYSAIDVSLQPMNGSPQHSGDSPVRGELST